MARTYPSRAHTVPGSAGYYESLLDNPNVQRGLATIRATEGTARARDPYSVGFGFAPIRDLSRHPGKSHGFTQTDGKANRTTAAGAYQMLSRTWNGVASKLGLNDFGPRAQDIAAVALIDARGGLKSLVNGDFRGFVNAVGPEWASLPSAPDKYKQNRKSWGFTERAWGQAGVDIAGAPLPPQRFQTIASKAVAPTSQSIRTAATLGALPVGGSTRLPDRAYAAPVAPVTRSPLTAIASALNPVSSAQAAPMPNRPSIGAVMGQGTVTPPSFASARMMAPAPSLPTQRFSQPVAPSTPANLSPQQVSAYRDYANTRAYAPVDPVPSRAPVAPPASGFLTSSLPVGQAQPLQQQAAQPMFAPTAPVQGPVQATVPVQAPPVPQMLAKPVQQRINEAFAAPAPAPRMPSAMDVYSGQANRGMASDGSTVSRDDYGRTAVTNKYGATTVSLPNGSQAFSGIGGPIGQPGIRTSTTRDMPSVPQRPSQLGGMVRGGIGSVVGGGLGGMLAGPIGAALGAVVASDLARGRNPIDRLGIGTFTTPVTDQFGFTQQMRFANPKSGGAFPDAPRNPAGGLGGKDSNRSERSMRDISPAAARDIKSGKTGLF